MNMQVGRPVVVGARSLETTVSPDVLFSSDQLLKVLSALRGSTLETQEKTALRDCILEYSQADDTTEKARIGKELAQLFQIHRSFVEPVLGTLSIEDNRVVSSPPNSKTITPSIFGRRRPQPTFSTAKSSDHIESTISSVDKSQHERKVPIRTMHTEELGQSSVPKEASQPKVEHDTMSVPNDDHQLVETAPDATTGDLKKRIVEIKRVVNERVGNPVNLIEKDKAIGQEYMSALLDAIKRSSGGGGIVPAMERLEKAFSAVETLLATDNKKDETVDELASHALRSEENHVDQDVHTKVSAQVQNELIQQQVTNEPTPKQKDVEEKNERLSRDPEKDSKETNPASNIPLVNVSIASARPQTRASVADPKTEKQQAKKPIQVSSIPSVADQVVKKEQEVNAISKKETQPRIPSTPSSPRNVPSRTIGADATLYTPEVDAGLEQLLSEWKLFKRSGIFGTGPHGSEHPLYHKLAQLPMAAVIAGRFEGATPEIRQIIADYMNGWRYEHGLVHQMEEQFEHYLRRVIRYIIGKQQQPPKATNQIARK